MLRNSFLETAFSQLIKKKKNEHTNVIYGDIYSCQPNDFQIPLWGPFCNGSSPGCSPCHEIVTMEYWNIGPPTYEPHLNTESFPNTPIFLKSLTKMPAQLKCFLQSHFRLHSFQRYRWKRSFECFSVLTSQKPEQHKTENFSLLSICPPSHAHQHLLPRLKGLWLDI